MRLRIVASCWMIALCLAGPTEIQAQDVQRPATPDSAVPGFGVTVALWPDASLPVGSPNEIVLQGEIRNNSVAGATWHGPGKESIGYAQVRGEGDGSLCETRRTDDGIATWTSRFAVGTKTPVLYSLAGISCPAAMAQRNDLKVRFCVNPHIFQPWEGDVCSGWIAVAVDPAGAAIRHSDDALRAQFTKMMETLDPADQRLALAALQVRALEATPSVQNLMQHPVASPDDHLATLWLEFFKDEELTIRRFQPNVKTVYTKVFPRTDDHGAPPPWPGPPAPSTLKNPEVRAQYERDIAENEKNRQASFRMRALEMTRDNSLTQFWLFVGPHYRKNPAAKEALFAQAKTMGLTDETIEAIRRQLSFGL